MFDPRGFRDVAQRCAFELAPVSGEAAYRTAISRAYYAAFLMVKERMVVGHGLQLDRRQPLHRQVLNSLKSVDQDTWESLERLRILRVEADYELNYRGASLDVQDALDYSQDVIDWVD